MINLQLFCPFVQPPFTAAVVTDFGLSSGIFNALSQHKTGQHAQKRLTAKERYNNHAPPFHSASAMPRYVHPRLARVLYFAQWLQDRWHCFVNSPNNIYKWIIRHVFCQNPSELQNGGLFASTLCPYPGNHFTWCQCFLYILAICSDEGSFGIQFFPYRKST